LSQETENKAEIIYNPFTGGTDVRGWRERWWPGVFLYIFHWM